MTQIRLQLERDSTHNVFIGRHNVKRPQGPGDITSGIAKGGEDMEQQTLGLDEPAAHGLTLTGKPLPQFDMPVRSPHGETPIRRPNSARRTMSIDVRWPGGVTEPGEYHGTARDLITLSDLENTKTTSEAVLDATVAKRQIQAISASPTPPRLQELVGVRAGGYLRSALLEVVPEELEAGTPLYLLLDDLAGASLVSTWALSQWRDDWLTIVRGPGGKTPVMQGICIGFRPGSPALDQEGRSRTNQNYSRVKPLVNPNDPKGWHALPDFPGVNFRRARRIDVWRDGDELVVESSFQDSASSRDRDGRISVHEYLIHAVVGSDNRLKQIEAIPGTLPYSSCRSAPANLEVLLGTPVRDLRNVVLEKLKFTGGCTHLNDMARALAEVPALAGGLP